MESVPPAVRSWAYVRLRCSSTTGGSRVPASSGVTIQAAAAVASRRRRLPGCCGQWPVWQWLRARLDADGLDGLDGRDGLDGLDVLRRLPTWQYGYQPV